MSPCLPAVYICCLHGLCRIWRSCHLFETFLSRKENLKELSQYCDEFLVHGVDVEGLQSGIEDSLEGRPISLQGYHKNLRVCCLARLFDRPLEMIATLTKCSSYKIAMLITDAPPPQKQCLGAKYFQGSILRARGCHYHPWVR